MSRNLRAGLVGLGMMGRHHARVLSSLENVELVAVCDPMGDPHKAAGDRTVLGSVKELINARIDYAMVAAPTAFHEVMHLFGLVDWYKSAEAKKAVGPNDMMNNSHSKQPIMHQTHWNSWGQDIKTRQQQQGNNFILNHFVE